VSATEMSITSGGREVSLNTYAMASWYQESSEEKNPNGEDVTGTLDSLRMDGGYSHTVGPKDKGDNCPAFKKQTGSKATCYTNRNDFIYKAQHTEKCNEAFEKDNFHTNLDGSKCFARMVGANTNCMHTQNSESYRPNFSSKTRSLCPGKFTSLMQGVGPVSNPNWSWCTGGWSVNTDKKPTNIWVPKYALPNKLVCRADEYGNTNVCRSKLKLQVFECATCKCAQLVTMTISHGLESSSDKGACKPWFVHADSGVRAYIAQYREKLLQQKSKEC